MFDALKLLGSIAENQSGSSAANRFGAAVQQGSSGGMLQQILAQIGGSGAQQGGPAGAPIPPSASFAPGSAQGGLGGMLGNFAEMAKRAASSPRQELGQNNPAAVGGLGALAGALLGGGRGAMGGGLMAVLGSLAYSALQNQGTSAAQGTGAANPPPISAGAPQGQADMQRKATLVIRAMIQAAKADGQVDQQETQRIMGQLGEHGHDTEARDFVANEMRRPIDVASLARDVTTPQEASEVYAASLLAIEVDSQTERDYLADLAAALHLPPSAVTQIHSALGVSA